MLYILGKEHSLDVMMNLHQHGWQTASEVARDLDIHIATAVKYLSELHELGLVNRRVRRARTRKAFEYQCEKEFIRIEFKLDALHGEIPRSYHGPLVLFSILYTILKKSRKVMGPNLDSLMRLRFKRLENGEKRIIMDSLNVKDDLEGAKDHFLKNLNGRALTEERGRDVVSALTELISYVIKQYESRLGHRSTKSLVDVSMEKVIDVMGADIVENSGFFDSLPYNYFENWRALAGQR